MKKISFDHLVRTIVVALVLLFCAISVWAQTSLIRDLPKLMQGRAEMQNALWNENPLSRQFRSSRRVIVAEIKGPAVITMIHFAVPQTKTLDRDLLLRMYWDGEENPSVECPLVDFFCDPNGLQDNVNSALVVVRQGFNCYFPMPFRKSAKVELEYDGPQEPGEKLWKMMPCYSYVCYRTQADIPPETGYFCASWKQETLKLGLKDYVAIDAKGQGRFVGWNVTLRQPGCDQPPGDENAKFYIDGETSASIEFQGLEDSFGFSWGFPPTENMAQWMGYFPFMLGDAGYRFFVLDPIDFQKSLKVVIGFGDNENPSFRKNYSRPGTSVQLASTVYWYQVEPHAPLSPMPPAADRVPAPEKLFWPEELKTPSAADYKGRDVKIALFCGLPNEVVYDEPGYSVSWRDKSEQRGEKYFLGLGWHCRWNSNTLGFDLQLPKGAKGDLRLYIIDADRFKGGRKETIIVCGKTVGTFEGFEDGRWIDVPVGSNETADGKLSVEIVSVNKSSNAVVSKIEWVEK